MARIAWGFLCPFQLSIASILTTYLTMDVKAGFLALDHEVAFTLQETSYEHVYSFVD